MKEKRFAFTIGRIWIYTLVSGLFFLSSNAFAQVKKVWALGDGEKVFREDMQHRDKNGNLIWDGKVIHLKGLYNETLAFQVIAENGTDTAKNIELSVDVPVNK